MGGWKCLRGYSDRGPDDVPCEYGPCHIVQIQADELYVSWFDETRDGIQHILFLSSSSDGRWRRGQSLVNPSLLIINTRWIGIKHQRWLRLSMCFSCSCHSSSVIGVFPRLSSGNSTQTLWWWISTIAWNLIMPINFNHPIYTYRRVFFPLPQRDPLERSSQVTGGKKQLPPISCYITHVPK